MNRAHDKDRADVNAIDPAKRVGVGARVACGFKQLISLIYIGDAKRCAAAVLPFRG